MRAPRAARFALFAAALAIAGVAARILRDLAAGALRAAGFFAAGALAAGFFAAAFGRAADFAAVFFALALCFSPFSPRASS
jgi:hypothetical protein